MTTTTEKYTTTYTLRVTMTRSQQVTDAGMMAEALAVHEAVRAALESPIVDVRWVIQNARCLDLLVTFAADGGLLSRGAATRRAAQAAAPASTVRVHLRSGSSEYPV